MMICDQQDSYGNFCIYPAEIRVIIDSEPMMVCKMCWERYYTEEDCEYILRPDP